MAKLLRIIKKNLLLLLILTIATILRFYNYSNRWVFNQDQARDITIALYAIRNRQIPLVGSPSSAGPFNFGALYDWLVILITFIFPLVNGPWIAFTLLSILSVYLFYQIGINLQDKKLGLILAILSATSPLVIHNSSDMLNTVAVFYAVCLNFVFITKYIQKPENIYLPLIGFTVGLANNFHFQSLGFGSILITFLIFNWRNFKQFLTNLLFVAGGFIISFLPNIVFDLLNDLKWSKSVFTYYFAGGTDKFYYPVRWLTDIRDFWPQLWGNIITGFGQFGYILVLAYLYILIRNYKKKSPTLRFNSILLTSLFIQVVMLRYYKGVRSSEYLITFHSYFIFLTGFILAHITRKVALLSFLAIIITLALSSLTKEINRPSQAQEIYNLYQQINQNKVTLYSLNGPNQVNLPLFYLYYRQNNIDLDTGYKIATCTPTQDYSCPHPSLIIASSPHYQIYDVNSLTDMQLSNYFQFTPKKIYNWLYINYPSAQIK